MNKLYQLAESRGMKRDDMIDEALREHHTIAMAARSLGVAPYAIRSILKGRGIDPSQFSSLPKRKTAQASK